MALNAASLKKLAKVKPDLVKVVNRAAEISAQPFQVVQGNRTQAEQNALYAQGRTKKGPIVTWTKKSKHIGGGAIDFAALVNGKISWNEKFYPVIAKAFKQAAQELGIGIEWGGDWKNKDWGHVQLTGKKVAAGVAAAAQVAANLPPAGRPLLKKGSKGEDVREVQTRLNGNGASLSLDGDFGAKTIAAVKAFQKARGLTVDGKVGPMTWDALLAPAEPMPLLVKSEPQWAVSFLESLGWSRMDAAVWVANLVWESGGNRSDPSKHTIIWNARGDKGSDGKFHSHGAAQWNDKHGRYQNLLAFAEKRGTAWDDRETQLRFLHHELITSELAAAKRVMAAETLEGKMKAALTFWRPSIPHADKRLAIARNLMGTILPPERRTPEKLTGLGAYAMMETDMVDEAKTVTVGGERATVEHVPGWKNWRTLAVNAAMAGAIPVVDYLSHVDWTQVVSPTVAVYVVIGVNVLMRFLTSGPAMSDVSVKKGS